MGDIFDEVFEKRKEPKKEQENLEEILSHAKFLAERGMYDECGEYLDDEDVYDERGNEITKTACENAIKNLLHLARDFVEDVVPTKNGLKFTELSLRDVFDTIKEYSTLQAIKFPEQEKKDIYHRLYVHCVMRARYYSEKLKDKSYRKVMDVCAEKLKELEKWAK